jgi:hypothetical protein
METPQDLRQLHIQQKGLQNVVLKPSILLFSL